MTEVRFIRLRPAAAVIAALTALCLAAGAAAEVPSLTVDDIVALLEAGVGESVILKQASLSGTRLVLTVDMLIQLKKAGASDEFLEALVSPPARDASRPDPVPVPEELLESDVVHTFRVYSEVDDNGESVVHITNLDASGRRIGGEIEPSSRANMVQPSEPPARREEAYRQDYDRSYDNDDRGQVVVNVYPPDSGSGGAAESYGPAPYDRYYDRYAPAYYGAGWSNHHFHSPTCGHYYYGTYPRYGYPAHHGLHGRYYGHRVGVPYLGSIRTVPYSYSFNSSAAARNRKAFGRR